MSSIKELTEVGRGLGLDGEELRQFIKDEQARERDIRMEGKTVKVGAVRVRG